MWKDELKGLDITHALKVVETQARYLLQCLHPFIPPQFAFLHISTNFWTPHPPTPTLNDVVCARYHAVGATFLASQGREWKDPDVEVHFKEMINQVNLNFKNIFNLFFPDPLM